MKAFLEEYGLVIVAIIIVAFLLGIAVWLNKSGRVDINAMVDKFTQNTQKAGTEYKSTTDDDIYRDGYEQGQTNVTITVSDSQSDWDLATKKKTLTYEAKTTDANKETRTVEIDGSALYDAGKEAGKAMVNEMTLTMTQDGWDMTTFKKKVYASTSTGKTAEIEVDGSSLYQKGKNDGKTEGKDGVKVTSEIGSSVLADGIEIQAKAYKDGVLAETKKASVKNNLSQDATWNEAQATDPVNNTYTKTITSEMNFDGTKVTKTITVDATEVYKKGYTLGKEDGLATFSVDIEQEPNWTITGTKGSKKYEKVVTAKGSNGTSKSLTVDASEAYKAGYDEAIEDKEVEVAAVDLTMEQDTDWTVENLPSGEKKYTKEVRGTLTNGKTDKVVVDGSDIYKQGVEDTNSNFTVTAKAGDWNTTDYTIDVEALGSNGSKDSVTIDGSWIYEKGKEDEKNDTKNNYEIRMSASGTWNIVNQQMVSAELYDKAGNMIGVGETYMVNGPVIDSITGGVASNAAHPASISVTAHATNGVSKTQTLYADATNVWNSVTVDSLTGGVASNAAHPASISVTAKAANGKTKTSTLYADATAQYNAGWNAVTVSQTQDANWTKGGTTESPTYKKSVKATASNGKTSTITVDATDVYEEGKKAAKKEFMSGLPDTLTFNVSRYDTDPGNTWNEATYNISSSAQGQTELLDLTFYDSATVAISTKSGSAYGGSWHYGANATFRVYDKLGNLLASAETVSGTQSNKVVSIDLRSFSGMGYFVIDFSGKTLHDGRANYRGWAEVGAVSLYKQE